MSEEEIRQMVIGVLGEVAPEADLDSVRPDVAFQEQFDIDSMDFLNFISGIAQRTGIEVPERDYPKVATLDGCVEYLAAHTAATAG